MTDTPEVPAHYDTEAGAIARLAVAAVDHVQVIGHDLGDEIVVTDRPVHRLDFERLLPYPRRPVGIVHVLGEASFVEAVQRWGNDAHSTVYVDTKSLDITAVLNDVSEITTDDGYPLAGWRDHRVVYDVPLSEAMRPWAEFTGEFMGQVDFAEFVEANLSAVADPAGRDLYEIVTTLEGTIEATWRHHHRDVDGARTFHYAEEATATTGTGGELTVPATFKLYVPVFENAEPREIEAKLRYRIRNGALALGFVLVEFDTVVRDEFQGVVERVHDGLGETFTVLLAEAPTYHDSSVSREAGVEVGPVAR